MCVVQGQRKFQCKCKIGGARGGASVKQGQWVVGVTVTEIIEPIGGYRSPVTGLEVGSLSDSVTAV